MRRNPWRAASFSLPAVLLIVFFLVLPLVLLFRYSLNRFVPGQFMVDALTFSNYAQAFTDPYYRKVVGQTIGMAGRCVLVILVAHTVRFEEDGVEVIRVISARPADRKERKRYEQG